MARDDPVFAALGDQTRLAVLFALADAAESEETPVSFTTLYDRLDIDSSSRFAYHLEHLTDSFVRKTDAGYALTHAGERIVRAMRAGTFTEAPSVAPVDLTGTCPACGETRLVGAYADPNLDVTCPACSTRVVRYDVSPAEVRGRSGEEVLRSCDRRARVAYQLAADGTCPDCGGVTDVEVSDEGDPRGVVRCSQCHLTLFAPLQVRALAHPAVVSFLWERGVDATAVPLWEIWGFIADWDLDVSPDGASVTVTSTGASITVRIDDSLAVEVVD